MFHELGAAVETIGCSPDGLNINDGVGATSPQALVAAVAEHQADYGIALDGDADRLQMVDAQGRLFNGDELLYVLAADRISQGGRCGSRRSDDQHRRRAARQVGCDGAPRSGPSVRETAVRGWHLGARAGY